MQRREVGFDVMRADDWLWPPPEGNGGKGGDFHKSHRTGGAVTDPLDDGERLLIQCNLFPEVPRDPGHVAFDWLENVCGHVHQVKTWHQHNTEHREWMKSAHISKASLVSDPYACLLNVNQANILCHVMET